MSVTKIPLSMVKIAAPCSASWEGMAGDEHARFCGQCSQHVYNFSAMTEAEIHALIQEREGSLCVRFYQRSDGTMMTADCPVGVSEGRRRSLLRGLGVAVFLAIVGALTFGALGRRDRSEDAERAFNPVKSVKDWLFPQPKRPCVMGKM